MKVSDLFIGESDYNRIQVCVVEKDRANQGERDQVWMCVCVRQAGN